MLVFSGSARGLRPAAWHGSVVLLLGLVACGCVNLDSVFDCAALCDNRPHARTHCDGAGCLVDGCDEGYGDCNQKTQDGCETNLVSTRDACGVCGNSCTENECSEGACWSVDPVTDNTVFARGLAIDAETLYYSANDLSHGATSLNATGVIYRQPLSGGDPEMVISGLDALGAIVLDNEAIYGFNTHFGPSPTQMASPFDNTGTSAFGVSKQGGTATFLGSTVLFADRPAVDDTDVYWPALVGATVDAGLVTTFDASDERAPGAASSIRANAIAHAPKGGGGAVSTIITHETDALDMIMHDGTLFFASNGVQTLAHGAEATSTLISDGFTWRLLVDSTRVYWLALEDTLPSATPSASVLKSVPIAGGEPTLLWRAVSTNGLSVNGLQMAQDDLSIYMADSAGTILRVPKTQGTATIIAGQQSCLTDLAVDDTYLYWSGCQGIRRMTKPQFQQ